MIAIITVTNWNGLGLALGLPPYILGRIKQQYTTVQDQLQDVLSHWIGTGNASWAVIVEALRSPLVNMEGLAKKIACNHLSKCV